MRKLNLYELLKMIDCNDLELPLYADAKGKIDCEPQSVYKVTLRFSAEDDAAVTVPIFLTAADSVVRLRGVLFQPERYRGQHGRLARIQRICAEEME